MSEQAIKSLFINTQPVSSRRELLISVAIVLIAAYILAPMNWEPGGESLKNWVSARIFRQTGGFPVLHHAPLYNIYLQLFLFLDYPLSIQLEHFVTHLFAYTSIFMLLRRFLSSVPALLLTCAWIPTLWGIEGGSRVAGIGFLSLYLRTDNDSVFNKGYLPASLFAGALCDSANIAFLFGHIVGTVIKRRSNKEPIITLPYFSQNVRFFPAIVKAVLVLLVIMTICFQSKSPDNTVHGYYYPWAPFPQTGILTVGSLQWGNWKYVMRNVPASEWVYQDWYFTHKDAFGGALNIFQAVLNRPDVFFRNMVSEIPEAVLVPLNFMVGFSFPGGLLKSLLFLFSWSFLLISFYRLVQYFKLNNLMPQVYSIVFGCSAAITALLMVHFKPRYTIVMLPVGLLITANIGTSFQLLLRSLYENYSFRSNSATAINTSTRSHKIIIFFASILIVSGFIANEWNLAALLSKDRFVALSSRILIWLVDLFLITGGILLIMKRDYFSSVFKQLKDAHYSNTPSWFTNAIILFLAICVLFTSYNPGNLTTGKYGFSSNPFLLSGEMTSVHRVLLASVDKTTKVLALEAPWIRAFGNVDLDNVFHPLYLPPFADISGETERFLNRLDVIWVSPEFSTKAPSLATQIYLRYHLHVAPFLEKALKNGWTVQSVDGFGNIYRRPISGMATPSKERIHSSEKQG